MFSPGREPGRTRGPRRTRFPGLTPGAIVGGVLLACFSAQGAQADRLAAEWTLLHGGRVALDGSPRVLTDIAELPLGDAFTVTLADWVGVNAVPQDLARLADLAGLRELRLPGPLWNRNADGGKNLSGEMVHLARLGALERLTFSDHFLDRIRFTDDGLLAIGGLDNLRELAIRQAEVKGPGLKPFRLLEALDIEICPVDDEGFRAIGDMRGLRRLRAANTLVTSAGLDALARLEHLEDLDLSGTAIDDEGVRRLGGLTKLRRLHLAGVEMGDAGIETLVRLPALEELNLYRTKVTNAGLRRLRESPALRSVDARYSRATAAGAAELAADGRVRVTFYAPPSLVETPAPPPGGGPAEVARWIRSIGGRVSADGASVSLRGAPVDDSTVAAVAAFGPALRRLDLSGTEIGDAGLAAAVAGLGGLEELDLGSTGVTDRGLAALAGLRRLRRLSLENTYVEGPGLPSLESLEELDLLGAPVDDDGLEAIAAAAPGVRRLHLGETDVGNAGLAALAVLPRLTHLDLAATDVDDAGLEALGKLTALRFLRLRDTRLSDEGLAHLGTLAALETLDLGRTRISNAGVAHLAELTSLRTLALDYADLDDDGLKPLAALTALRDLNIDSTHVGDAAVAQLAAYSKLERVNLYHTLVTPEGAARLRQALPGCEIVWDPQSSVNNRRRA